MKTAVSRVVPLACMLAVCGVSHAAPVGFSDDFNDIAASSSGFSVKVFQDSGLVFQDGSITNSYGGFIGSGASAQVVMVEDFAAGVGGSSALRLSVETLAGDDNTGGINFFGGTYEDAAVFSGTVTEADVQSLTLAFDYATTLTGDYFLRVERLGGDFGNRVDLGLLPNTGGAFQAASFDLGQADPTQVTNLVAAINSSANPSILQIVLANAGDPNTYLNGSSLIIDNLNITAVPEPATTSSIAVAIIFGAAAPVRRWRRA